MLRSRTAIFDGAAQRQRPSDPRSEGSLRRSPGGLPDIEHPLALLLAATSIPILLFAAWIAYQSADSQRSDALAHAQNTVDRVAERITAEMANQVQVAEALSLSPSLDGSDLASFYREAQRLKAARPLWYTVELDDLQGQQVLNLLRPLGDPLGPTADRESFDEVLHDQKPVIGGIGPVGAVSGRHLLDIRLPVTRDKTLRFVLTVAMAPDAVSAILRHAGLPVGWIGAVADRRGNLVARSLAEEEHLGRPAAPSMHAAIGKSSGGFYKGLTLEGVPVDTIFRTLPEAGLWSVHLGIPSDALNGPVRHALYAVAAGVLVSLAMATALTVFVARGIAAQRRNEGQRSAAALSASEDRADLAIEAAELGTWGWDFEHDRITASERCRSLLDLPGRDDGQMLWPSAAFLNAIHPDDRQLVLTGVETCLDEDTPLEVDFRVPGEDGGLRWLRARGRSRGAADDQAVALYGIILDVGAQKRAEADRLDLLRRLASAQEDVQRRIAHDLHDQVGQTVTGLSLGLKGLERAVEGLDASMAERGPSLTERVRWLQGLTGEIGRDIHQASVDLRPTALDDLGLPRALGALIADWSGRYGITADVQIMDADASRLPPETETVLYRVAQEALTNVLKHAEARNVSIVFDRRLKLIRMVIEDDGRGFDAEGAGRDQTARSDGRPSLGLSGMRERLALIGGTLRVESSSVGTTLFVTIALDQSDPTPGPR